MVEVLGASNRNRVISSLKAITHAHLTSKRRAAVLVPLLLVNSEPSVLLTVRSTLLPRHRGQVSFPGGLVESCDGTATETALRESEEELGLCPQLVDVWGEMDVLPDRQRSMVITPVLGSLGTFDVSTLKPDPSEVRAVFTMPLKTLANPDYRRYTCFKPYHINYPVFLGGVRRVWGLTAFILDLTLKYVLPNSITHTQIL